MHVAWDQSLAFHKPEGIGGCRVGVGSCDAHIPIIQVTDAEEPQIQGYQPLRTSSKLNNDKGTRHTKPEEMH